MYVAWHNLFAFYHNFQSQTSQGVILNERGNKYDFVKNATYE